MHHLYDISMCCTQVTWATDMFSPASLNVPPDVSPAIFLHAHECVTFAVLPQMFTIANGWLLEARSTKRTQENMIVLFCCIECTRGVPGYLACRDAKGLSPSLRKKKGGDPQSSRKPSSRGTEIDKQFSTLWEWRSVRTGSRIFLVTSCHVRMSILCWQHSVISKQIL